MIRRRRRRSSCNEIGACGIRIHKKTEKQMTLNSLKTITTHRAPAPCLLYACASLVDRSLHVLLSRSFRPGRVSQRSVHATISVIPLTVEFTCMVFRLSDMLSSKFYMRGVSSVHSRDCRPSIILRALDQHFASSLFGLRVSSSHHYN